MRVMFENLLGDNSYYFLRLTSYLGATKGIAQLILINLYIQRYTFFCDLLFFPWKVTFHVKGLFVLFIISVS